MQVISVKNSQLKFENKWIIAENQYSMENEPNMATLFTTSNGYIGVRGSFEEFGSLRIQGCYIRGLIDEIYELMQPFPDNIYMKKYYFDEEKLKDFEKQESIINFADILLVRIKIGEETFYPWEGTIHYWKRYLDLENACLVREVRWENTNGDITYFKFERFASFDNDHIYCQRVTIAPENHGKKIEILSGIDRRTKTNGQRVTNEISAKTCGSRVFYTNNSGEKYKFIFSTGVCSSLYNSSGQELTRWEEVNDNGLLAGRLVFDSVKGERYTLEKKIYVTTSRDEQDTKDEQASLDVIVTREIDKLNKLRYRELYGSHAAAWKNFFGNIDIDIHGDEVADLSLRFSNYHTAISIPRHDSIHSIAAKGLTGETYNNFVWWDCEVYQLPVFLHTNPDSAKNAILYRYRMLDSARNNARQEGMKGARFPFTSSVMGNETVWKYARHPFLQIHIVADVAWAVINYYICTGDTQFLLDYGLEILWEVSRYWAGRVEYNQKEDRYEIKNVTGTDEHHPYVDNNAYTNYLVCLVLKYAVVMYEKFRDESGGVVKKIGLEPSEIDEWKKIAQKIYLPMEKDTGLIPQFDGYFDLSRELEVSGSGTGKSFQMKESGLYHKSQVIKQPDVMLLFSYINLKFDETIYKRNWDYYEARCEASSSLSYPVHSICASDMGQPERAYKYFLKSTRIDMDDEHNCAWQGIHSACAAGAWLAVVRGVAGIVFREDAIEINPNMIPWWKAVVFKIIWHGQVIKVTLSNGEMQLLSMETNTNPVPVNFRGKEFVLEPGKQLNFNIAINKDPRNVFDI